MSIKVPPYKHAYLIYEDGYPIGVMDNLEDAKQFVDRLFAKYAKRSEDVFEERFAENCFRFRDWDNGSFAARYGWENIAELREIFAYDSNGDYIEVEVKS